MKRTRGHGRAAQKLKSTPESIEVERDGRRFQLHRASWWTALMAAVVVNAVVLDADEPWQSPAARLLIALLAGQTLLMLLRWQGVRAVGRLSAPTPRPKAKPAAPMPPRGTVITCSGGGIKSASFCLGGLQRLQEGPLLDQADWIVGVSGGGYSAAAFTTMRWRARARTGRYRPFQLESGELVRLRGSTRYLLSSGEAWFNLIASVLLGIIINLLVVGSLCFTAAWVVAQYARDIELLHVPTDLKGPWQWNHPQDRPTWLLFALPAALLALGLVWFALGRGLLFAPFAKVYGGRRLRVRVATRLSDVLPNKLQPTVGNGVRRIRRVSPGVAGDLSARCAVVAGLVALVFPGTLLGAYWLQLLVLRLREARLLPTLSGPILSLLPLAPVLGAFLGLLGSAHSGLTAPSPVTGASRPESFMRWFRRQASPLLGVFLFVLGFMALLAMLTRFALAEREPVATYGWTGLLAVVLMTWVLDPNEVSLFPYYRDRLRSAFLGSEPGGKPAAPDGVPTLTEVNPNGCKPALVLCATANVRGDPSIPAGRHGTQFVLSSQVGIPRGVDGKPVTLPARHFRFRNIEGDERLDVASAIAISGAAISPVAGRDDRVFGRYRLLFAVANVRLGVWLRNPYWVQNDGARANLHGWSRFVTSLNQRVDAGALYLLYQEALGSPRLNMPRLYVTDGGHFDNLGLVESLRRRPARIILLDGSGDAEDEFPAMANAISTARVDLGVEIFFNPAPLTRGARSHPLSGWTRARARYPDGGRCVIDYVKCVLPAGTSWDLESYRLRNPTFPATFQGYELFDEFDFEAYRQLGYTLVAEAEKQW
jgi:hypothetical protein